MRVDGRRKSSKLVGMARTRTPTADTPSGVIARAVRAEMARTGMTGEALAERLGWTQRKVSYRLTGTSPFRADELVAVAAALDVDIQDLLPPVTDPDLGLRRVAGGAA